VFDDHGGDRCRPTPTGYAATDLKVCLLAAGTELEAPLATDLVRLQRDAMHRLERLADARGRANADHRVCALLRALCDTLTPPRPRDRLPVGLQQRDLGQLLGMRHETVCRVLTRLERLGVIARSDDGITITDRAQLDAM
jgi:CRP-like cAMP-binding protein